MGGRVDADLWSDGPSLPPEQAGSGRVGMLGSRDIITFSTALDASVSEVRQVPSSSSVNPHRQPREGRIYGLERGLGPQRQGCVGVRGVPRRHLAREREEAAEIAAVGGSRHGFSCQIPTEGAKKHQLLRD